MTFPQRFAGKTVLVTGAGTGLGPRSRCAHQRLDTARPPRPGRDGAGFVHGEALDAAGDVTTDHSARRCRSYGAVPRGHDRPRDLGRRDCDVFERWHTTHGFRYVRVEGHPGDLAAGDVTGVVVTRTCRGPAGLPAATTGSTRSTRRRCGASAATPATSPPTARTGNGRAGPRLAAVRAHRGVPLRRGRVFRQVAARRRRGPVGRRDHREHVAGRARGGARRPGRVPNGSACWGDAIVIVPWSSTAPTATSSCWPSCGRTWSARLTGRDDWRRRAGTRRVPAPCGRTSATCGTRLPLGRVAGAWRRYVGPVRGVRWPRQVRCRDGLLRPVGRN